MIFENSKGKWELPEILNYEEYSYNLSCTCDNCDYYLQHPSYVLVSMTISKFKKNNYDTSNRLDDRGLGAG